MPLSRQLDDIDETFPAAAATATFQPGTWFTRDASGWHIHFLRDSAVIEVQHETNLKQGARKFQTSGDVDHDWINF